MNPNGARAQPWYREPWPWILMSGPALVVVAGLVTAWLAVRSDDGLVVDDYYKQGLAINQTLSRSEAAVRLGIKAELHLADGRVRAHVAGAAGAALTLRLVHPTRAGMDQSVHLKLVQPGIYEGRLAPVQAGRWHVVLEQDSWRLAGDWLLPAKGALTLDGHARAAAGLEKSGKSGEGGR
jgi:hypothetical protein